MINKPSKVKYKGKYYPINRGHWEVLEVIDWLMNGNLDEIDQAIMIVTIIFGKDAPVEQPLVDLATEVVSVKQDHVNARPRSNEKGNKRDMCFIQDYPIYRADIIREYNIDIAKENIDFDTLVNLIENLSHKSRLVQIRELRNQDLSKIKDIKLRKEYREAQRYYKLKDIGTNNKEETKEDEKEIDKKLHDLAKEFI